LVGSGCRKVQPPANFSQINHWCQRKFVREALDVFYGFKCGAEIVCPCVATVPGPPRRFRVEALNSSAVIVQWRPADDRLQRNPGHSQQLHPWRLIPIILHYYILYLHPLHLVIYHSRYCVVRITPFSACRYRSIRFWDIRDKSPKLSHRILDFFCFLQIVRERVSAIAKIVLNSRACLTAHHVTKFREVALTGFRIITANEPNFKPIFERLLFFRLSYLSHVGGMMLAV